MAEDLEQVGVRPVPKPRHRATATGRAAAVSHLLRQNGVQTRDHDKPAAQGVWVYAFLPHSARVEVRVREARVRQAVIDRVREVLQGGDYVVSQMIYTDKVVLYATKDAPDTRRRRDQKREA